MSTQNTRNSSQGTEVAPNGIMTPHDLLSLSSRERKQAIRSLLEYQQSTFHTLRAQVTNELEDPSKSPQEKRQLQNLLNSMNNSMERVESEYRKHEARIQRATRDSAAMERGKVAVELQELVLIEQFGDTVDPSLLKDFSRLDIGSFFVMLGRHGSDIRQALNEGGKISKRDFESWGYRSNGAFGRLELSTLQKATQAFVNHPHSGELTDLYMSGYTIYDLRRMEQDQQENKPLVYPSGRLRSDAIEKMMPDSLKEGAVISQLRYADNLNVLAVANDLSGAVRMDANNPMKTLQENADQIDQLVSQSYEQLEQDARNDTTGAISRYLRESGGKGFWTGRIRREAMNAFVNLDKEGGHTGIGSMSFETFVRGLTVSVAGVTNTESRNLRPGVVIHFNALNKTSVDGRTNISAGVGTSVLPVFVPFANASLSRAEQVDMNHPVDPTVQTVSGVLGSGFGSVVYSREKSPMNTFEQMQYQLSEKCNQLARMSLDEIMADPTLDDYYKYRIQSVYDQAGVDHRTSETTKLLLLQGLAQSEIEKLQVNTANAEAKRMSYRGASVGVGHIMGVTFPLAGVTFGRLKLDYQRLASNDDSMTPSIEPVSYTPAPDPKVMEVGPVNRLNRHQEALQKFKWEIYRASDAKGSVFDRVLQSISSRDYDTAMQLLSQPPKGKEQIFRQIRSFAGEQGLTIEERNKRLRAVMSYVYGSPLVTDKTRVTPRDFLNTRTDKVRTAEANILGLSGLDITAESKFNSVAAHTPQELAQFVPLQGQHLSSMIVSTSLRAQHRVDVYPASVEVSGAHIENIDDKPAIKAKLLRHPTLQADIDERYHDTLAQLDMTPDQFSREQYVKYLETGNTQDLPSGVQPVDNKSVKWYEARAMISSSNCLNLTYALGYPVFVGTPDEQVAPQPEMVEIYGLTVTERRVNLGASARQQDKPRGTTTPGTEENPDPNAETTPGTIDNGPNDAPPPQTGDSGGTSEGHHEGGSFGDTPSPGAPSPETPSPGTDSQGSVPGGVFETGNPLSDGEVARLHNVVSGSKSNKAYEYYRVPGSRTQRRRPKK